MLELTVDDTRKLIYFLETNQTNNPIAHRLVKALSCLGFNTMTDSGLLIMQAPEQSNYNLNEFDAL